MEDENFEGSLVLEKLASFNLLNKFYNAVDNDDIELVKKLLKHAQIDRDEIKIVIEKIVNGSEP